jgi:uncharacterized protein (DUF2141 family)
LKSTLTACTAAIALLSFAALARADACASIEVQNLRLNQGPLMIAAYGDAANFRKTAAASMQLPVSAETMQVQLCNLTGPIVALTLYQDLNGNGKLDANAFGVPSEPWGASGKTSAMTAPTWETTQIPLDGSTIVVKLSK